MSIYTSTCPPGAPRGWPMPPIKSASPSKPGHALPPADIRPIRLRLEAASMPETHENAEFAERDEVRVLFTFRETEVPARQSARRFGCRRVVFIALLEVD